MSDPRREPVQILVGKSAKYNYLTLALGTRHGLVAGSMGTQVAREIMRGVLGGLQR